MKKTTRLTALLIALVLLLANISASATETSGTTEDNGAFPVGDLDMARYSTMLMTASEGNTGLYGSCTDTDCVYSQYQAITGDSVNNVAVSKEVMQYKYMMGDLYSVSDTQLEDFLGHVSGWHTLMPTDICICYVPVYAPGSSAHEEDCPWYNLSTTIDEHYAVYQSLNLTHKACYLLGLDEAQLTNLKAKLTEAEQAEMENLLQTEIPDYLRTEAVQSWIASNANVSAEMVNRAYEVDNQLTASSADYSALDALRLEGSKLISVETGLTIATYDETTGALTDVSMGLIVGYVVDGKVVSAADMVNE